MNFERVLRKNLRAISPVLATVILIAITLIAAIAIAGFVFGLFGSFTKTAQVQASVVSCSPTANPSACSLSIVNSGNANVNTLGSCTLSYLGSTYQGTTVAQTITAGGGVISATCTTTSGPVIGTGVSLTGTIALSNSGSVIFSGST